LRNYSLFRKLSFKGGVHPPDNKHYTRALSIEELPPPDTVIIPLSMHIGAPAQIAVKRGDQVKIGQVIGESAGFISAPVHSSVSGEVTSVGPFPHPSGRHMTAVEITNDGKDEFARMEPLNKSWREAAPGEIIQKIASCGIVGMGGASFPTHVKLSPPSEKKIDTIIINCAECEPYLTADYRLIIEKTNEMLFGMLILKKTLGARVGYIGIEDNKPEAIEALKKAMSDTKFNGVKVVKLQTKYPQGGEKQLINAITKREVPSGGLPMDIGCVVHNAGTTFAVWDAVCNGTPLYQRVVTVAGAGVNKPANLLVRIGTPIRHVLNHCSADFSSSKKVIVGGPMMGVTVSELDTPVIKATSGLIVSADTQPAVSEYECIHCGRCIKACPIHLSPYALAKYVAKKMYTEADTWSVLDCIECGSCAYVCPSKINLVQYIKLGKYHVTEARKAGAAKQRDDKES
jgi:electron transport complex protein RnfC